MDNYANSEMITLAREIRELTQKELAELSDVSQASISRYEGNIITVPKSDLEKLSKALDFPVAFFYQEGKRRGPETAEIFHRKRRTISAKQQRKIDGLLNLYRLGTEELLKPFDQVSPYHIPSFDARSHDDIADIAMKVRALWNMPSGPVSNLIEQLEAASCLVFSYDFGTDKMDENTQWIEPNPPIILVNSRAPGDRLRFSLAHALGHLVMHHNRNVWQDPDFDEDQLENEADKFAAAFLMPEDDILDELEPVTIDHLLHLKQYWKVSMQALIKRASDLGLISDRRYTSLFTMLSRAGYRKKEPMPIPREHPKLVKKLVQSYRVEMNYSEHELAKLLHLSEHDFMTWYTDKPPLRIVKRELDAG